MLKPRATIDGLAAALAANSVQVFDAVDNEMKAAGDGLKAELRQQTQDALGVRVANAWRGNFYSNAGTSSGPAAFVWSKAPKIIDFFSAAKVVTPLGDAFAIPTDNVPRGPRGRRLSPIEVEARFNTELHAIKLPSGRIGLVMDLVSASSSRRPGFRTASGRRLAGGRKARPVLMFVLLRGPLRGRQLIDLDALANRWASIAASKIERRLGD